MRRLRLAALLLLLALPTGFALGADDLFPPDAAATHKYDAKTGTAEFCVTVNVDLWDGKFFDVEFNGSWAPGVNAPENKFKAPAGWSWEPVGSGGWRAKSDTPMRKGQKYCFTLPVNPPLDKAINLTATDKNHQPIHNFLSTEAVPLAAPGAVKTRFSLGNTPDPADGIFGNPEGTCGTPRGFNGVFVFSTNSRSQLTIRNVELRNGVTGPIARNGVFHLRTRSQAYDGAIQGRFVDAQYRRKTGGCREQFTAQFELERAGRVVRAQSCRKPRIVAPDSARIRDNAVRFPVSLVCNGNRFSGKTIDVWVRTPTGRLHVGPFKSDDVPFHLRVNLGKTHPDRIELFFRGGRGLAPSRHFIRLIY
ncbi:MAG: hypothetical protein M3R70_06970 [Actinomycetota bacterium]|nr:hypothetical protein [Actinomycetota bacterium]